MTRYDAEYPPSPHRYSIARAAPALPLAAPGGSAHLARILAEAHYCYEAPAPPVGAPFGAGKMGEAERFTPPASARNSTTLPIRGRQDRESSRHSLPKTFPPPA